MCSFSMEKCIIKKVYDAVKVFYRSLGQSIMAFVLEMLIKEVFLIGAEDHSLSLAVYVADCCIGI